jgi:hypothetical protein
MAESKSLSVKQLAVIDDLFNGELKESEILEKHNISRKLYEKWLADESFNRQLDSRMVWEYRRNEIILARSVHEAVSNLMELTKSKQAETARKACIDIITMRANLLAGTPALPVNNATLTPTESQQFSPETTGKLLAILAEEEAIGAS